MYQYGIKQTPNIAPASGSQEPVVSRLLNSVANRFLMCRISATIQISVANATAVRNGGWVAALFSDMGILEAGNPIAAGDPRMFAFASEYYRGGPGTATHLTSPNIGTYNLVQEVMIPFELVNHAVNPRETQLLELDPAAALELYFTQAANNGRDRILTVGGATVAITNVTVKVQQYYDRLEGDLPLFRPSWRQFSQRINGASSELEVPVAMSHYLRGFTLLQDSDEGRQTANINKVGLRGDSGWIIEPIDWDTFARSREFFSGGNVYAEPSGSMVHYQFQEAGRLKNILSPFQDNNLRFVMDVPAPTGTNPHIRVLLHQLEREPKGKATRRVTVPQDQFPPIGT
jgi:hypothetical protein